MDIGSRIKEIRSDLLSPSLRNSAEWQLSQLGSMNLENVSHVSISFGQLPRL